MGGDPKPMGLEGKICMLIAFLAGSTVLILSFTDDVNDPNDHPMYLVYQDFNADDFKNCQ